VRGRTANGRDILTGVTVIEPRAGRKRHDLP
jgi:hypothetical protein